MNFKEYYLKHAKDFSMEIGKIVEQEMYAPENRDLPPELYVAIAKVSEAIFIRSFLLYENWKNNPEKD